MTDQANAVHASTMSEFEMAVLATQARAAIGRLCEFIGFPPNEKASLDAVTSILASLLPDHIGDARGRPIDNALNLPAALKAAEDED